MKNIDYNITEEETLKIERLFHEKTMHESIIAELVNTNPAMSIRDTNIYNELIDIAREYHSTMDSLIKKYTDNKYGANAKWSVLFKERILRIAVNAGD